MLWACCDNDSKTALLVGVDTRGASLISIDRLDDNPSLQDNALNNWLLGAAAEFYARFTLTMSPIPYTSR